MKKQDNTKAAKQNNILNTNKPREGWKEAIISAGTDDKPLLPEFPEDFDVSQWTWEK